MKATHTATIGTETQSVTRSASAPVGFEVQTFAPGNDQIEPARFSPLHSEGETTGLPASPETGAPLQPDLPLVGWKRLSRAATIGLAPLVLLVYFSSAYFSYVRSWVKTDNAYLAAHVSSISSRVAGTVKEVLVDENQTVAAGARLARLDARDFEVHRQQALAQVAQAQAQFREAEARIAQARAQVSSEQARALKAKNDLTRAASLYQGSSGAISRQELELAQADADASEAALQGAKAALDSATASAAAAQAQETTARATLEDAGLQLSYTEILAPVAGRVGKRNLETGNRVQPGQALLALVQTDTWVSANFKETQLAHLKVGQPVQVRVDAFPGRTFRGTVESFSPGSGAQFALLPPDNATGNFTKIVQRVPVKIVLDRASLGDCEGRLVAGMSAVVEVRIRD